MKNIENPQKISLLRVIDNLREGAYAIPDFQREFEWNPGDVNELIRSIFEDYYIGTMLLWRAEKKNLEFLSCEGIYGYHGWQRPMGKHIVLDGQQRLSALHYALFAPDIPFPRRKLRYFFFIDLARLLEGNFDEAFRYEYGRAAQSYLDDETKQFNERLFPVRMLGEKGIAWVQWLDRYQAHWTGKGETTIQQDKDKLQDFFNELLSKFDISYIELDRDIEVAKVCDIFTRINNTGIKLNIFDLLNALLRPKEINLKQQWRAVSSEFHLPSPDSGKIFLLQAMSILKQEYCASKYLYYLVPGVVKKLREREKDGSLTETILLKDKEEFNELWSVILENSLKAQQRLENHNDLGAIVPKFIPYPTMLPLLTVLTIEKDKPEYPNKNALQDKIRAWYWASVFTTHYSSSVESQLAQDYREMKRWFADDSKVPTVLRKFKRAVEAPDLFEKLSPSSAIYKGIFCLIAKRGAKDFFSWEPPEYSVIDDHHMVPQSWGKRNGVERIDSILNRTPISDDTNRKIISDHLPNVYIKKMIEETKDEGKIYKLFETHLVPREAVDILLKDPFTPDDFNAYIRLREKAIRQEILGLMKNIDIPQTDEESDIEEDTLEEEFLLEPSLLLHCTRSGAVAQAHPGRGKKIRVLKGSVAVSTVAPSFLTHNYNINIREYLLREGIIAEQGGKMVFTQEYEFSSPSAAAAVVLGCSVDGPLEWVDEKGRNLYQIKEQGTTG